MNLSAPSDFPLTAFKDVQNSFSETPKNFKSEKIQNQASNGERQALHFGVRPVPNDRFIWNLHLLKPVMNNLHPDWLLFITHGFVDQSNVSVYGRSIYMTLIARRSNKYAGTRFLKRGANFEVR